MHSRIPVLVSAALLLASAAAGQAVIQNEADGKSDINADFLDGYDRSAFLLASGDDLTGALNANYYSIENLSDPDNPRDAVPRRYVDINGIGNLSKTLSINNTAGDNDINMSGNEITNLPDSFDLSDAVDKEYVDTSDNTIEDNQGLGDVLSIDNRVEGEGINFDQSSSIQSAGTDVIRLDANQNIALPNGNLDMNGNNITNPNQIDGVDLDNPGNALSVNQDQLKVDTQGDIAAGSGLSGGNNNVLPGSDSDVTVSLNADDLDNQGNIDDFSAASDLGSGGDISDSSVQNAELDLANGLTVAGGSAGDGTQSGFEVDSDGNIYVSGSLNLPGDINTVNAQEIDGSIVPDTDATLNLGSGQNRYSNLYLADNIYDTSGNSPFFDGGCSEDQYITGITSTGQIQCSNEPDDTDDDVNNGELDNLFSGSGILTRTGSGTYTTTTDNVQDGDTSDTNELQDLENVRSRDNTLNGAIDMGGNRLEDVGTPNSEDDAFSAEYWARRNNKPVTMSHDGYISWDGSQLSWSDRLIVIPTGNAGTHFSVDASNSPVNIGDWNVMYIRPSNSDYTDGGSVDLAPQTADYQNYDPKPNDVVLAWKNGDTSKLYLSSGETLATGERIDANSIDRNRNFNLGGNNINNIGGLQNCGNNQFVDGNGNCETDDDRPGGNDFGNADDLDAQGDVNTGGQIDVNEIDFRPDGSDPYNLRMIERGSNSHELRLELNDDDDEKFTIYGNSCDTANGCSGTGQNLVNFISNGNVEIVRGDLSVGGSIDETADVAEVMERKNKNAEIEAGDVVAIKSGKVTKNTSGSTLNMVVSAKPGVRLGGQVSQKLSQEEQERLEEKRLDIAFTGRVPTKILGEAESGDYVMPSGGNNGTAVAVPEEEIGFQEYKEAVGVVLERFKVPEHMSKNNTEEYREVLRKAEGKDYQIYNVAVGVK